MSLNQKSSSGSSDIAIPKTSSPDKTKYKRQKNPRVDWHEAASCALQIELRDYSDLLEYLPEYILGKNSYRIDSYYKTIGYAGLLIAQSSAKNQYSRHDISLTFLSCHYPRKLMKHLHSLQKEKKLTIEKFSPGVYHINKETFNTQIIVTSRLSPEEYLYLHCLTNKLQDTGLVNHLADDYKLHQEQDIYIRYMHQLTTANKKTKGDLLMVCEGLLNLFGTSSEEIIERTRKEEAEYYLPKINTLSSQNNYLKSLLAQNNIPFNLDAEISDR